MKFQYLAAIAMIFLLASCGRSSVNLTNNRPSSSPNQFTQSDRNDAQKFNIFGAKSAVENMGKNVPNFLASIPMPEPEPRMMMSSKMSKR